MKPCSRGSEYHFGGSQVAAFAIAVGEVGTQVAVHDDSDAPVRPDMACSTRDLSHRWPHHGSVSARPEGPVAQAWKFRYPVFVQAGDRHISAAPLLSRSREEYARVHSHSDLSRVVPPFFWRLPNQD